MTEKRFMVDDAGTLIDILTRDTFDYVSDVCPVMNKLWLQTQRFEKHNQELENENEELKQRINSRLHFYRELYDSTNDDIVKRVVEDLEDILKR